MKILVGMSGGLDSTYTAHMLISQGHEVEGAVLKMHAYTDIAAAKEAADAVGIKLNVIDCQKDFEDFVIRNFIDEYSAGKTPNPCVICNRYVKIDRLCGFAAENGFDRVSTGHYAESEHDDDTGRYFLRRAKDQKKDQSYVLWHLTQKQLKMLYTPLFDRCKSDIKAEAADMKLAAADRKESQENCFIPDNDYASFIINRLGKDRFPEGDFIDETGKKVGRHKGIIYYTVGQRKKLGLSLGKPVFVSKISPSDNTVTITPEGGEFMNTITVSGLNFQLLTPPDDSAVKKLEADVKIRYGATPAKAEVICSKDRAEVRFYEPVRAATPGQSAVFYSDGKILFGGFIESSESSRQTIE